MTTMTHYCLGKPVFGGSAAVAAATEIIAKMGIKFLGISDRTVRPTV